MPPPPQPNPQDNSAGMLWGVAAVFAAVGIIWYAFKNAIAGFYISLKLHELNLIDKIFELLHLNTDRFDQLRTLLMTAQTNPAATSLNDMLSMGAGVGTWLKIPFFLALAVLAIIIYKSSITRVYRRRYNMKELAGLEKVNWPQISPMLNVDLVKMDIDKGPWAMAMTPMQFCKRYQLLEEVRNQRTPGTTRKQWHSIGVVLKRGEANKLFALQLGPLFKGTQYLPPHTKALFAAFAARINADTKPALALLKQLSLSADKKQLDMTGVDALIQKHEPSKQVQHIIASHAYISTLMASMLEQSRQDGVQASADFLWLKLVDRRLWYTLNTVGRQTPFIEVGGIYAHWLAEKEAGRRLLVPMVEEATNAVEIALREVIYRPEETS